ATAVTKPWAVVQGANDIGYVTTDDGHIYSASPTTGLVKDEINLAMKLRGLAFRRGRTALLVGTTNNGIWSLTGGADGRLSDPQRLPSPVNYPNTLAVDECDNVYAGSHDGTVTRIRPDGKTSVLASLSNWEVSWMVFGAGEGGWSDRSLYVVDTQR